MPLKLLKRSVWDPDPVPQTNFFVQIPIQYVFLMNTASKSCLSNDECFQTLKDVVKVARRNHHMKDLRFNFLIGDDGYTYEGRGWYIAPMLPLRYSRFSNYSLLIGFIGKQTVTNLSEIAAEQAADLIQFGVDNSLIRKDFELKNIMVTSHGNARI